MLPRHRRPEVRERVLGTVAGVALQPARLLRRRALATPHDVAVVLLAGAGELQLATPALRVLRAALPAARLTLWTATPARDFAVGTGLFDAVRVLDLAEERWGRLAARLGAAARQVRAAAYDLVLDLDPGSRVARALALASCAPEVLGLAAAPVRRDGAHTALVPLDPQRHVARDYRALALAALGRDDEPGALAPAPFRIARAHRLEAATALLEVGLADSGPLVALAPRVGPAAGWAPERHAELARRLVVEDGARVVLVAPPGERCATRHVRALAGDLPPGRCVDLGGRLSTGGLVALARESEVLVADDGDPLHLAAAQGVPVLGLYGPTSPRRRAPLGPRARALSVARACSPCLDASPLRVPACGHARPACLAGVAVGFVLACVRDELGRARELAPAEDPFAAHGR